MAIGMSRRGVLAAGGGALATLFAGCGAIPFVGDGDDDVNGTDWPMAAHDARSTNRTAATLPDEPTEQWRMTFDIWQLTPVVADGTVYVLTPDNDGGFGDSPPSTVYALDAGTGDEEWIEPLPDSREFHSRPAAGDGSVVYATTADTSFKTPAAATDEMRLHARTTEMGEQRWQLDLPAAVGWSTVVDDTILTAGTRDERTGLVGAFEATSGERRWEEELDVWVSGRPATDGDLVVALTASGTVFALDFETGERRWTHFDNPAKAAFRSRSPVLGERRVFTFRHHVSRGETTLHALTRDGDVDWQRTVPGKPPRKGAPFALGLADERVLCLTKEGYPESTTRLIAFDRASGDERWIYTVSSDGHHETGQLTLTTGSALFAADDRLHAVSLAGKKRWERPVDQVAFTKPIVADGRLYLNVTGADEEGTSLAAFA